MKRTWATGVLSALLIVACSDRAGDLAAPAREATTLSGTITIVRGDDQWIVSADSLPTLTVEVLDDGGAPIPEALVQWSVSSGGGALRRSTTRTGVAGRSHNRWLPGASGTQQVEATVDGIGSVVFDAYFPPAGSTIRIQSGNGQVASIGSDTLPDDLRVRVARDDGTPIAGIEVTWQVLSGAGSLRGSTSVTGVNGIALNRWLPGTNTGSQSVRAQISGVGAVTFTATVVNGPAITNITFTPARIYTTESSNTVRVTFHARDYRTVKYGLVRLFEEAHERAGCSTDTGTLTRISGSNTDGDWQCDITVPQNNYPSLMTVRVEVQNIHNTPTVTEASTQLIRNDFAAPALQNIRVNPKGVDERFAEPFPTPVTIRWRALDLAGVGNQAAELWTEPPENCTVACSPTPTHSCVGVLESGGDNHDGTYSCVITVQSLTEQRRVRIYTSDLAGNNKRVTTGYLLIPGD